MPDQPTTDAPAADDVVELAAMTTTPEGPPVVDHVQVPPQAP